MPSGGIRKRQLANTLAPAPPASACNPFVRRVFSRPRIIERELATSTISAVRAAREDISGRLHGRLTFSWAFIAINAALGQRVWPPQIDSGELASARCVSSSPPRRSHGVASRYVASRRVASPPRAASSIRLGRPRRRLYPPRYKFSRGDSAFDIINRKRRLVPRRVCYRWRRTRYTIAALAISEHSRTHRNPAISVSILFLCRSIETCEEKNERNTRDSPRSDGATCPRYLPSVQNGRTERRVFH